MAKPEISMTRLYELVEVDTLRGLVFRRGTCRRLGRLHPNGYRQVSICAGVTVLEHRLIWAFAHAAWPSRSLQIDHVNGDPVDNRLCNLRLATVSQNAGNRRSVRKDSTTGFIGVWCYPSGRRFGARITVGRTTRWLGAFSTPEAAHLAYQRAHVELVGEFSPYYREVVS